MDFWKQSFKLKKNLNVFNRFSKVAHVKNAKCEASNVLLTLSHYCSENILLNLL